MVTDMIRKMISRSFAKGAACFRGLSPRHTPGPGGNTYYDEKASKYLDERLKQPYWPIEQEAVRQLLTFVPDNATVLDVPFGTGRFLGFYLEKHMTVRGLDISADMLQAARAEWGNRLDQCIVDVGDATKMPYPDGHFDLVVCFRFLQSIVSFGDAKKTLHEIARVTKRHAIVQLRVRDAGEPSPAALTDAAPMSNNLYFPEIISLLRGHGLAVVKVVSNATRRQQSEQFAFLCERISRP